MRKPKRRLSRLQFEALFPGEWEKQKGDRFRKNGKFTTAIVKEKGWKVCHDGKNAIRAKTWLAIAKALELA